MEGEVVATAVVTEAVVKIGEVARITKEIKRQKRLNSINKTTD